MQTPYVRKICFILITLVLIVFSILAIKTIAKTHTYIEVEAYEMTTTDEPTSVSDDGTEYRVVKDENIDRTMKEIHTNVSTIEDLLLRVQTMTPVEIFDDIVWTTTSLHFRDFPSTDGISMTTLSTGTALHRLGRCSNGWYYVEYNEKVGYVHDDYVTDVEPYVVQLEAGKETYQSYALSLFSQYGWSDAELEPLIILWNRESGWNPLAENPSSGAYGIPQSLPGDKMASFGDDWRTNYQTQIQWGLWYINQRYGTPTEALNHSYDTGWY